MPEHVQRSVLPHPPKAVWDWHMRPGAFERLSPPWQPVEVVRWAPIEKGARQHLRIRRGVPWAWEAQIAEVVDGQRFRDVQVSGPFAKWEHTHTFTATGRAGTTLEDRLAWELPFAAVAERIAGPRVARDIATVFAFRHARTRADLDRHYDRPRRRIAVSGASGFIGRELCHFLTSGGHSVPHLVRRPVHNPSEILWRPEREEVDADKLEGIDAVVHLAGEPLGQRWTADARRRILESRVAGTLHLCRTLARLKQPPEVLVCGSAVGYYGDRGDEILDENSPRGGGFLADVAGRWEEATATAQDAGIRVVNLRTGIVLDPRGGALQPIRLAASLGLSGRIGDGSQYVPWIALDDLVGLINHLLFEPRVGGPVNGTAPEPVPQSRFAETLAEVLRRPTLLRVPAAEVGLLLGDQGREMLLFGQRVYPEKAIASGFAYQHADLEGCLRFLLGRPQRFDHPT